MMKEKTPIQQLQMLTDQVNELSKKNTSLVDAIKTLNLQLRSLQKIVHRNTQKNIRINQDLQNLAAKK